MTAVIESEEHKALRAAVAALGKRYGRDYVTRTVAEGKPPPNSGPTPAGSAISASTSPRSTAAEAAA
ncbi:hypothetical protein ACFQ3Z_21190 [Streptomyces nogalater]